MLDVASFMQVPTYVVYSSRKFKTPVDRQIARSQTGGLFM
jgi:hypothetical protein